MKEPASLKDCTNTSLRRLENVAKDSGWDQILHMVRDERQVREA